ncbi:XRE family transcriptional regulator [Ensifer sesbaniae]|uniref:S24 family peptidase n=1 Tax=Ensifer sesbaniae TaxID=1214071 RepID=UPI00200177A7|nr:XRE family transcriptional regulator [Ensifer sesbaniae]
MIKIVDRLRAIRQATKWTQVQLAEHLSVTQSTVNRWFQGAEPEGHRRDLIIALYNEVVNNGPKTSDGDIVPLMGYIGAGAEIEPDFEQTPPEGLDQIHVPFPLPDEMVAFEVRGDSMLPVYKNGHVVIVYKDQKRPLEAFYGEEAAVRTADGRRFIKTVMRGVDGVNLMSWNAAPIENVHLDWVGEIFAVLPRTSLKHVERKGGIQGRLRVG